MEVVDIIEAVLDQQVAEVRELDAREKGGQLRGHLLSHRQRETV